MIYVSGVAWHGLLVGLGARVQIRLKDSQLCFPLCCRVADALLGTDEIDGAHILGRRTRITSSILRSRSLLMSLSAFSLEGALSAVQMSETVRLRGFGTNRAIE